MLGSSGKIENQLLHIFSFSCAFVIIFCFILYAVIHLFLTFAVGNENLKFDLATAFIHSRVTEVPWSTVLLIVCSLSKFNL